MFAAADPTALDAFRRADTDALPFLEGALRRHLEDFPAIPDGLSRSERQILRALDGQERTVTALFRATQAIEERIFMGDVTFWAVVRRLAEARHPLVTLLASGADAPMSGRRAQLTTAGRDLLDGRDHVELNGIDHWMGGVHLTDGRYRWDGTRLVNGRMA